MEKIKTDEELLQDFLLDIECLDELDPWLYRFNIFDVLKISRTEIRHSNMLAWLIDPKENHGVGDLFLKGFIQRIVEYDNEGKYDIFQMLLLDLHDVVVLREWKNIDLLIISHKENVLIAIENKVGSKEHSDQLNRYRTILEKEYPNYDKLYIFLTPDGEEPSDVVNWSVITYKDIVEILDNVKNKAKVIPDVEMMINNYIEVIRRDIVEDEKLVEICNKIYEKHTRALDLIYANRIDSLSQFSMLVKDIFKKIKFEYGITETSLNKRYIMFHSDFMDQQLGNLCNSNGSWSSDAIYQYWFYIEEGKFRISFELGGLNITDEQKQKFEQIILWLKPNDKNNMEFKYKRVWGTKWYNINDELNEDMIENKMHSALKDLKKFEEEFAEKMKF